MFQISNRRQKNFAGASGHGRLFLLFVSIDEAADIRSIFSKTESFATNSRSNILESFVLQGTRVPRSISLGRQPLSLTPFSRLIVRSICIALPPCSWLEENRQISESPEQLSASGWDSPETSFSLARVGPFTTFSRGSFSLSLLSNSVYNSSGAERASVVRQSVSWRVINQSSLRTCETRSAALSRLPRTL